MDRAVSGLPKGGLNHRNLEPCAVFGIDISGLCPSRAVVGGNVNECFPLAVDLSRSGCKNGAVLKSDGLILDGSSAAAVVAGDKLSGSAPASAVGRGCVIGLPVIGVGADLEVKNDSAVFLLEQNGVPVSYVISRGNNDGIAPAILFGANRGVDLNIALLLGRAAEPCCDNGAVIEGQNR